MALQHLPSSHDEALSITNATAVAVDKDKNSQHAIRWATDHLVINNAILVVLHVRHKNHQYQVTNGGDGDIEEMEQLFTPIRAFCARKGVQVKEFVLDDIDVSRAILEFIHQHLIGSIVVGASTRNAITRKFKNQDVPTTLMKSAPDFCSVYVIAKGKIASVRTAQRQVANTAVPPRMSGFQAFPPLPQPHSPGDHSDPSEDGVRGLFGKGSKHSMGRGSDPMRTPQRERSRNSPSNRSTESIDMAFLHPQRSSTVHEPTSDDHDFPGLLALGSLDISAQNLDFSVATNSPREYNQQSVRDLEAEMRRLRLELKQTMDMYSTACKEALSAKRKANELHQWKMEEARRFEEARLSEEAALAIAEMEKAKCKVALEAAEKSQKIAEKEAQKRKYAEMKAKRESEEKNRALDALSHNDVRYRKYSIEEIELATDRFTDLNKIGEGGYGPVYKGTLDHTPVAIKVLRPDAAQGKKQFQQEVEVLSSIRHPNMVLLLGACPEYGCLVYEYMENGSLDDRLFRRDNTPPLSWRKRFKIAAEIATALLFLHQAKPEPLVHRDLKPANILLDRNYVSKISDVGLARLVPPSVADSVTHFHMTSAAGTFCYIDPEYQQTGMLTTRSDVYSMGILLLQIITAKPPMGLAHQVGKSIERGNFAEMLDQTVPDWPVEEALSFAKLALQCSELRKKDRPSLATVVVPELNRLRDLGRHYDGHSSSHRNCSHHNIRSIGTSSHVRTPEAVQENAYQASIRRTEYRSNSSEDDR